MKNAFKIYILMIGLLVKGYANTVTGKPNGDRRKLIFFFWPSLTFAKL